MTYVKKLMEHKNWVFNFKAADLQPARAIESPTLSQCEARHVIVCVDRVRDLMAWSGRQGAEILV